MLQKTRIGLTQLSWFPCPDGWRTREQPEKKEISLLKSLDSVCGVLGRYLEDSFSVSR
jgi:hypothetical protein